MDSLPFTPLTLGNFRVFHREGSEKEKKKMGKMIWERKRVRNLRERETKVEGSSLQKVRQS